MNQLSSSGNYRHYSRENSLSSIAGPATSQELPGYISKKRKENPQFFHYYTNENVENDKISADNRRNKKKKLDGGEDVGEDSLQSPLEDQKQPPPVEDSGSEGFKLPRSEPS